jgi:hypothetical protein
MKKNQKATEGTEVSVVKEIVITPPNYATMTFCIRGTAPYVQLPMNKKQEDIYGPTGQAAAKNKKKKEEPDRDKEYNESCYVSEKGWNGIPCKAIKDAMIAACRVSDYQMVKARMAFDVLGEGRDPRYLYSLARIYGTRERFDSYPRIPGRGGATVPQLRVRSMWKEWYANVTVTWDDDQFHVTDIANLLARAGIQVGVGEGRPLSRNSSGMGWGTFTVEKIESEAEQ